MKALLLHFIFFITLLALFLLAFYFLGKDIWYPYYKKCYLEKEFQPLPCPECKECNLTHVDLNATPPIVVEQNSTEVRNITLTSLPRTEKISSQRRLKHLLADSNFVLYPKKLTIIGLKNEQLLEVWGEHNGQQIHLESYPFTGFSGRLGPKFREGDQQIPEGIYGISYLNPNSSYHLSMKINYPNAFDKEMARLEKRSNLGGDIMIHGKDKTIGCVPIGDDSIEELYFLAEKVGIQNIKVILAPVDFRTTNVEIKNDKHPWLRKLYANISKEMQPFISK